MTLSVFDLQNRLAFLRYDPGMPDGVLGPKTTAAVMAFQKDHGLVADGIVGPLTEAALETAQVTQSVPAPSMPAPIPRPTSPGLSLDVIAAAQAAQKTWGVPASVSLAQFGLESAWGTKMPAGSNNPFGIKAKAGQPSVPARTREVVGGQSVYITAQFRKFANFAEAFDEHGRLIGSKPVYAVAMQVWETTHDLDRFVASLARVYATDPEYHGLIMGIIKSKNLAQFDAA